MKKLIIAATVGAVLSLSPGGDLAAQPWNAGLPGEDLLSVAIRLGAVSPTTTLPDGSKFSGGLGGAVSATFWAHPNVGIRGNYEFGKTEGNNLALAPASQENPTVSFFGGELNLRYPMNTGSLALAPYIGAGAGGKMYDWSEDSTGIDADVAFAWNLTGGLDIRPVSSPWVGLALEAKRYSSEYIWHSMIWEEPKFNDFYFSVGITLNK